MKWLALICCFYFIALSCAPCLCDDMNAGNTTEHSRSASPDDHNKELCTPFCSCAGCIAPAFFLQKSMAVPSATITHTSKDYTQLTQHFTSYNLDSIWQPPRIG